MLPLSAILWNIESWYNLTDAEVEELQILDRILLRKILQVSKSCPSIYLYLDLGVAPLKRMIQAKRVMFLQYILTRKDDDLLKKFFLAQCRNPSKNDWCHTVRQDLSELGISNEFDDIKKLSKYQLSKLVKSACVEKSFDDLILAQERYSKGKELNYGKLKIRSYFTTNNISKEQAILIFKFRVRLINVKANMRSNYLNDIICPVCSLEEDLQQHLISCKPLNKCNVTTLEYNSLFGCNEDKMLDVIQKMQILLKQREDILQESN